MIFCFSSTGNTAWAARTVQEKTGERLVWIHEAVREDSLNYVLNPDERIGLMFPVHGWRPPRIVREFCERLTVDGAESHYTYALVTAGDNIGETINILEDDLRARGITLHSAFSLIMPESYVGLPFMDVDKPEKEALKKRKAAEDLDRYLPMILERRKGERHLVVGHWPRINSRLIGAFFIKRLITDWPFRVDWRKCTRCGTCARVCPVSDILQLGEDLPLWVHNDRCLTCFACYHHCPVKAIDFGGRTRHKGQYYFEKKKQQGI